MFSIFVEKMIELRIGRFVPNVSVFNIYWKMTEIHMGDLFSTYLDFEARLKMYKITVDLYIADSRILVSASIGCPCIVQRMPELLKYYFVKFKWVQGGTSKVK